MLLKSSEVSVVESCVLAVEGKAQLANFVITTVEVQLKNYAGSINSGSQIRVGRTYCLTTM